MKNDPYSPHYVAFDDDTLDQDAGDLTRKGQDLWIGWTAYDRKSPWSFTEKERKSLFLSSFSAESEQKATTGCARILELDYGEFTNGDTSMLPKVDGGGREYWHRYKRWWKTKSSMIIIDTSAFLIQVYIFLFFSQDLNQSPWGGRTTWKTQWRGFWFSKKATLW